MPGGFRTVGLDQSVGMLTIDRPEELLETAVAAFESENGRSILDHFPAPVYATDAQGNVTYWNRACVEFAGRSPALGQDRWCVTWQLFTTDGDVLPHDQCPMARAIKERRAIRGEIAIALRPDGSRAAFRAYPTPLFDADGALTGGVTLLLDVSEEQAGALKEQAARCRRLARATNDTQTSQVLKTMASGYEETAASLHHH